MENGGRKLGVGKKDVALHLRTEFSLRMNILSEQILLLLWRWILFRGLETGQVLGRANLVSGHVKTQLIAHDKEVYDIAFSKAGGGRDMFASVGADGKSEPVALHWIIASSLPTGFGQGFVQWNFTDQLSSSHFSELACFWKKFPNISRCKKASLLS